METLHTHNIYHLNLQPKTILCNLPNGINFTKLNNFLHKKHAPNSGSSQDESSSSNNNNNNSNNDRSPLSASNTNKGGDIFSLLDEDDDGDEDGDEDDGKDDYKGQEKEKEKKKEDRYINVPLPQLCIIDFSHAVRCEEHDVNSLEILHEMNEIYYNSPESTYDDLIHGWKLGKVDVWNIGIITYLLLIGYHPFSGANQELLKMKRGGYKNSSSIKNKSGGPTKNSNKVNKIDSKVYDKCTILELIRNSRYTLGYNNELGNVSGIGKDFLKNSLMADSMKRFNVGNALRHPWIKYWYIYCIYLKAMKDQSIQNLNDFKQAS